MAVTRPAKMAGHERWRPEWLVREVAVATG
jgi:hypothetical protein